MEGMCSEWLRVICVRKQKMMENYCLCEGSCLVGQGTRLYGI